MPRAVNPDPKQFTQLGQLHCTYDELAAWFSVDVRTVKRWMKKPAIADAFAKGKATGRISLRRTQMTMALGDPANGIAPDKTMLIWLGKQLLAQRDVVENSTKLSVTDRRTSDPYKNLSVDDLRSLETIMDKAASETSAADGTEDD